MHELTKLYLDSEMVTPTGNIVPQGIINQLGRPNLDTIAMLVREAVQNSWDARVSDDQPVHFRLSGWTMTQEQRHTLRRTVFAECPPNSSLDLTGLLDSDEDLCALAVCDSGTVGLGGPTRADVPLSDDGAKNFVDFLRNIGQPSAQRMSGGTYGFGKAAFYRASHVRTICVYTRCRWNGEPQGRFIGAALGAPYQINGVKYTGRHWWGQEEGGIAEPLMNRQADAVAQAIGLPVFPSSECGTIILILQPFINQARSAGETERRSPHDTLNLAAEYLLWYFWPKMLRYDSCNPAMVFEVDWNGNPIAIPDPEGYPPLQGFVQAMRRHKDTHVDLENPFAYQVVEITSQRPAKYLGKLALQKFPVHHEPNFHMVEGNDARFSALTHHTALMRQPELIVKYLPGAAMPSDKIGYAGVFIADEVVDAVFANAEPPTHDNWVPDSLEERWHRTYVRVALRRISQEMDSFTKPPTAHGLLSSLTPLGAFANTLGRSLLPSELGPSATFEPLGVYSTQRQADSRSRKAPSGTPGTASQRLMEQNGSFGSQNSEQAPNLTISAAKPVHLNIGPSAQSPSKSTGRGNSGGASQSRQHMRGKPRVKPLSEGEFVEVNGMLGLKIEFSVKPAADSLGTVVHASVQAILDGNQPETEPPIGGSLAHVVKWIAPDGTEYESSSSVYIPASADGNWWIVVSLPDDMMVGIDLSGEAKLSI